MKIKWILSAIAAVLFVIYCLPLIYCYVERPGLSPIVTGPSQRIVSLSPNITEILFAMQLGEKVIAVSSDSDYPPDAAERNKVGTFWQPNTEAIISYQPDLVVTEQFEQQRVVAESLKRLGYQVLALKIEKVDDLFAAIEEIGLVTDKRAEASKLTNSIVKNLNNLRAAMDAVEKVKVLWVVQPEPLRVAGRSTFVDEIIERAGGENAVGETIQQYPNIGTEELLVCGAEVIIQSAMSKANMAEQQKAAESFWSKYPNLPAVKNNRIFVIDPDVVLRLGPRLPKGIEIVEGYLHPNIVVAKDAADAN